MVSGGAWEQMVSRKKDVNAFSLGALVAPERRLLIYVYIHLQCTRVCVYIYIYMFIDKCVFTARNNDSDPFTDLAQGSSR